VGNEKYLAEGKNAFQEVQPDGRRHEKIKLGKTPFPYRLREFPDDGDDGDVDGREDRRAYKARQKKAEIRFGVFKQPEICFHLTGNYNVYWHPAQ
jgi:hypothetical protein